MHVNGITLGPKDACYCERGVSGVSEKAGFKTCLIPQKGEPSICLYIAYML